MSCPYFRLATVSGHVAPRPGVSQQEESDAVVAVQRNPVASSPVFRPAGASYVAELKACRAEIMALLEEINCNPILVRCTRPDTA
jgi:hypothetical protein